MQLCFVSVHGPRETYFVDEPRTLKITTGHTRTSQSVRVFVSRCLLTDPLPPCSHFYQLAYLTAAP
jgi:hypothetical protein